MNSSMNPKSQKSFLQRLWLRIEGLTHPLVHFFHVIGGVVFVIGVVGSILAVFTTELGNNTYHRALAILKSDLGVASLFVILLAAIILNVIFSVYINRHKGKSGAEIFKANEQITERQQRIARYKTNEANFLHWSEENAFCDRFLFDKLFKEATETGVTDKAVAEGAVRIEENIGDTVQFASDILSCFTGFSCTAALQILKSDTIGLHLLARKEWRDKNSRGRHFENEKTYLSNESAFSDVMEGRTPYFKDDDLKSNTSYINKKYGWRDEFNAMIVCGVERLDRNETQGDYYYGALIITNKEGGLANETATHYSTELSQRLAVMAYRLETLQKRAQEGKKT